MRIAVYAGSFDPITNGHLDIIHRAAKQFDKIVITIAVNPAKKGMFSMENRATMIRDALGGKAMISTTDVQRDIADHPDTQFFITILPPNYMVTKWMMCIGSRTLIRGLRANMDFEAEFQMNGINKKLEPLVDSVFFMTSVDQLCTSSSAVKEISRLGGDVSHFVPPNVQIALAGPIKTWVVSDLKDPKPGFYKTVGHKPAFHFRIMDSEYGLIIWGFSIFGNIPGYRTYGVRFSEWAGRPENAPLYVTTDYDRTLRSSKVM